MCEKEAYAQALSWLIFGGDRAWPLKFARGQKYWPQGPIFKSQNPYRVVPQMKGIDEYFQDQSEFLQYDVIWRHNDAKTVLPQNFTTSNLDHM